MQTKTKLRVPHAHHAVTSVPPRRVCVSYSQLMREKSLVPKIPGMT